MTEFELKLLRRMEHVDERCRRYGSRNWPRVVLSTVFGEEHEELDRLWHRSEFVGGYFVITERHQLDNKLFWKLYFERATLKDL